MQTALLSVLVPPAWAALVHGAPLHGVRLSVDGVVCSPAEHTSTSICLHCVFHSIEYVSELNSHPNHSMC